MKEIINYAKVIVLFDGDCMLCNNLVQYIIKRDKKNIFMFASLQSKRGKSIIEELKIIDYKGDSIILYDSDKKYYQKSEAVFQIAKRLVGIYKLILVFQFLPLALNDSVYEYVAKNRVKWFGKSTQCIITTDEISKKFI